MTRNLLPVLLTALHKLRLPSHLNSTAFRMLLRASRSIKRGEVRLTISYADIADMMHHTTRTSKKHTKALREYHVLDWEPHQIRRRFHAKNTYTFTLPLPPQATAQTCHGEAMAFRAALGAKTSPESLMEREKKKRSVDLREKAKTPEDEAAALQAQIAAQQRYLAAVDRGDSLFAQAAREELARLDAALTALEARPPQE